LGDWSCIARRYTSRPKRHFGRKDKRKKAKWKTTTQNTRLDEEKRQWVYILSEFERDGTVSNYVEKLVPITCHRKRKCNVLLLVKA